MHSAAHLIPEVLVHEILENVAYLNKQMWVQTIKPMGQGTGQGTSQGTSQGRVRLNKYSNIVRNLTSHIHEKARLGRNRWTDYVEMYRYSSLNTEDATPIITGWATYHPLLLNCEEDPTENSKEYTYVFFEDDPSSFAWVCYGHDHRKGNFVFDRGLLYTNNNIYKMIMKKEGWRIVSNVNKEHQVDQEDQDEWFDKFKVYLCTEMRISP